MKKKLSRPLQTGEALWLSHLCFLAGLYTDNPWLPPSGCLLVWSQIVSVNAEHLWMNDESMDRLSSWSGKEKDWLNSFQVQQLPFLLNELLRHERLPFLAGIFYAVPKETIISGSGRLKGQGNRNHRHGCPPQRGWEHAVLWEMGSWGQPKSTAGMHISWDGKNMMMIQDNGCFAIPIPALACWWALLGHLHTLCAKCTSTVSFCSVEMKAGR